MRKGQIKNHGYSLTLKLCRYSPQVLLSLPTSISECCCLSEKKKKKKSKLCTSPEHELESLIVSHIFLIVPSLFSYLLTFKHVWGECAIGLSETHRCTDSLPHIPLPNWKPLLMCAFLRCFGCFKNLICSGVCNFTLKKEHIKCIFSLAKQIL